MKTTFKMSQFDENGIFRMVDVEGKVYSSERTKAMGIDCVLHTYDCYSKYKWAISEVTSGHRIAGGKTQKEAIALAEMNLYTVNKERLHLMLKHAIEHNEERERLYGEGRKCHSQTT